jgi:DNA-nicking Smr family endonuclease
MKGKKLSSEDLKLWDKVTGSTKPLDKKKPVVHDTPPKKNKLRSVIKPQRVSPKIKTLSQSANEPFQKKVILENSQKVKMDMKAFTKLKKGKLEPEDTLDLHGMTLETAFPALSSFICRAHSTQKRLVLVITGKGKNTDPGYAVPQRNGVLRSQVPIWLKEPRLSSLVLQIERAHHRHGGLGAFYIYLRRNRAN